MNLTFVVTWSGDLHPVSEAPLSCTDVKNKFEIEVIICIFKNHILMIIKNLSILQHGFSYTEKITQLIEIHFILETDY